MKIEVLTSLKSLLAEGPLYFDQEDAVYWTDIDSGLLHRYGLKDSSVTTIHEGSKIGGFTIQEDGSFLLFRQSGAIHHFKDGTITPILDQIDDEITTRFNDVAADPEGRVFCGTMPTSDRRGRLYRLDRDGSIRIVLEDVGCSNGIGWSVDTKTMYFTDTAESKIFAFDYDPASGEISNRRVHFHLESEGGPDGMTVDGDGNLWVAVWGGRCVLKVGATGQILERHEVPAVKITCPTFGGKDLDQLFVTTAGGDHPEDGEGAGELLRLTPEEHETRVVGKPEFRSRIKVPENR